MAKTPKITRRKISDYLPDTHNANKGTERGLQMIEDSLHNVGAGRSLVADANDNLVAGNKTMEGAALAGITEVIEIETDGNAIIVHKRTDWDLSDPTGTARQYAYLDNRASELSLSWDAGVIAQDIEAGIDLSGMFTQPEIEYIESGAGDYEPPDDTPPQRYTRKIDIPIYEPSNERPAIETLYDDARTIELMKEIDNAFGVSDEERLFLKLAAQRHTVLNFARIADLYAHASPQLQRLMENSALIIIDYNRAIELGYAKMTKQIAEMVGKEIAESKG